MKSKFLFIIGLFWAQMAWAQTDLIDSLSRLLAQPAPDTAKVDWLEEIGYAYYPIDLDSTLYFAQKGYELAKKINYGKGQAANMRNLGIYHRFEGNYPKATQYFLEALEMSRKNGYSDVEEKCLISLSTLANSEKDYDLAIRYAEEGLALTTRNNSLHRKGICLLNLGDFHNNKGNYKKALEYLLASEKINAQEAELNANLAKAYIGLREFGKAQKVLDRGFKYLNLRAFHDRIALKYSQTLLYYSDKNYGAAVDFGNKTLQDIQQTHNTVFLLQILDLISKSYEGLADNSKALEYYKRLSMVQDTLFDREKEKQIEYLKNHFHAQQQSQQITLLETEKRLQTEETQNQRLALTTLLAGLFLLVCLFLILWFNYRAKNQTNQYLKEKNYEIQQHTEELQQANEQVLIQKDKLEKAYENIQVLEEIGRKITANLDIDKIADTVYENINQLLDAEIFLVGLYDAENQVINEVSVIEKGVEIPCISYSTHEKNRLAVWCLDNQKDILMNDLQQEYKLYIPDHDFPEVKAGETPSSLIYAPLILKNEIVGVISVQSSRKNAYSPNDLNFLRNIAVYTAIALENAETKNNLALLVNFRTKEIQQAYQNVELLSEIGRKISTNLKIEKIAEVVYENVNRLMDATVFLIGLYHAEKQKIEIVSAIKNGEKVANFSFTMTEKNRPAIWCVENKMPFFSNDYANDHEIYFPDQAIPTPKTDKSVNSLIYLPLFKQDEVIGVISVQAFQKDAYSQKDLNFLRNIAVYIVIALGNAEAYERLEEKVAERTAEIKQSYQNLELLGQIGQKITATLDLHSIFDQVYQYVNAFLDATIFGIGLYNEEKQTIDYEMALERGVKYLPYQRDMQDKSQLAVQCIEEKKEILLNEVLEEKNRDENTLLADGTTNEPPQSLIYLPLLGKEGKVLGVISVQSFQKNAYAAKDLNFLRNIAIYTAIALENADSYRQIQRTLDDLKATQAQLVHAEKMAGIGTLTAGIAHEINNPINFVKNNIENIETNLDDILDVIAEYERITPENAAEKLQEIEKLKIKRDFEMAIEEMEELVQGVKDGANRTAEIVKSLRTFTRLDDQARQPAKLHDNLDATLLLLQNQYKDRIEIVKKYGSDIPKIDCFIGKINQVFMNLLSNAIQAIESKGTITISTEFLNPAGFQNPQGLVQIRIRDSGGGIPEAIRHKVFEPFFTTKDVGKGTGLGLSISLGIAQSHGGDLKFESEMGKGTEFVLTLPVE